VQALTARRLAPGFPGLWIAVDMTWTLHPNIAPQDVADWESLLNILLIQVPVVLLCQYSRSRLPADTLHHELRTHPMAILGERVYPNFFYESPDVYLNKSAHWQRLDWMFSQLRAAAALEEERARRIRSDLMLQEVHHQVKNSMQIAASLLSLQAAKVEDPASRAILWETEARIRTIATVHAKLYATDMERKLDFAEYLQEFLPSRILTYEDNPLRIRIEVVGSGLYLDSETALPCALVVNELVTNAVKYAFPADRPGAIRVEVAAPSSGQASIVVRDNGVGFPHSIDVHNADTLGLQLVNALARQIHGVIQLDQSAGHPGATFRLHFPATQ